MSLHPLMGCQNTHSLEQRNTEMGNSTLTISVIIYNVNELHTCSSLLRISS